MKKFLIVSILLILVLVGGACYLVTNINDIIVKAVNTYGPGFTQTDVHLDKADLDIFSGKGILHGFSIGNPEGFGGKAVEIGSIAADVDVSTVLKDVIVVKSVVIDTPRVGLMMKGSAINLKALLDNVAKASGDQPKETKTGTEPDKGPASTRVIIDDLRISGTQASIVLPILNIAKDVTLSDIHLTGIGRKSNGATYGEIAGQLLGVLLEKLTEDQVGEALGPGGKLLLHLIGRSSVSPTEDLRIKATGTVFKRLFGGKGSTE